MIPRLRATGSMDNCCTIIQQEPPKDELGFDFMAGKRIWQACGRSAEYGAQRVLIDKELERA